MILDTSKLTKIEIRALAIENATGAQKESLIAEWQQRYKYAYPQYAADWSGAPVVCNLRERYRDAAILQPPVQCQVEADGDRLWA